MANGAGNGVASDDGAAPHPIFWRLDSCQAAFVGPTALSTIGLSCGRKLKFIPAHIRRPRIPASQSLAAALFRFGQQPVKACLSGHISKRSVPSFCSAITDRK